MVSGIETWVNSGVVCLYHGGKNNRMIKTIGVDIEGVIVDLRNMTRK